MIQGIGTDVVAVARVDRLLRTGGERFVSRWFTDAEASYCQAKAHPAQHFAARLAAKEAVAKALRLSQDRNVPWRDIEIVRGAGGAPGLQLHGEIATLAPRDAYWHVSMSHTEEQASATVLVETGRARQEPEDRGAVACQATSRLPFAVSESLAELACWSTDAGDPQLEAVRVAITLEEVADIVFSDEQITPELLGDAARAADLLETLLGRA